MEYTRDQVSTLKEGEVVPFWSKPGCGPAAVTERGSGFLVACSSGDSVVELNAEGHEVRSWGPFKGRDKGPNDFAPDGQGGHYFTVAGEFTLEAPTEGDIYHLDITGRLKRVASGIHYSNGIDFDKQENTLLVCEHLENRLRQYRFLPDGSLSQDWRIFAKFSELAPHHRDLSGGLQGPDGMRRGEDGTLFVAQYAGYRVMKLNPKGEWIGEIELLGSFPNTTNLWVRGNRIYITAGEEKASNPGGILVQIDDSKLSSRKNLKCQVQAHSD